MHKSARKESRLCGKGSWRENKVSAIIVRAVDSSEKCGASGCSGDDLKQLRRTYCISEQLLDGNEIVGSFFFRISNPQSRVKLTE